MSAEGEKIALFIDGANLYATAKSWASTSTTSGCCWNSSRAVT
jgi:hypothetical protein